MPTLDLTDDEVALIRQELAWSLGETSRVAKLSHDPDENRKKFLPAMRERGKLLRKIRQQLLPIP